MPATASSWPCRHTPPEWGEQPAHGELVTVRDGKLTKMVVYPTVDEALVAAGLTRAWLPRAAAQARNEPGV